MWFMCRKEGMTKKGLMEEMCMSWLCKGTEGLGHGAIDRDWNMWNLHRRWEHLEQKISVLKSWMWCQRLQNPGQIVWCQTPGCCRFMQGKKTELVRVHRLRRKTESKGRVNTWMQEYMEKAYEVCYFRILSLPLTLYLFPPMFYYVNSVHFILLTSALPTLSHLTLPTNARYTFFSPVCRWRAKRLLASSVTCLRSAD